MELFIYEFLDSGSVVILCKKPQQKAVCSELQFYYARNKMFAQIKVLVHLRTSLYNLGYN